MKKRLLFALSIFLITIVGLLVFFEALNKTNQETSKFKPIEQQKANKKITKNSIIR